MRKPEKYQPRGKTRGERISLQLPSDLLCWLRNSQKEDRVSNSARIVKIIREYLGEK